MLVQDIQSILNVSLLQLHVHREHHKLNRGFSIIDFTLLNLEIHIIK